MTSSPTMASRSIFTAGVPPMTAASKSRGAAAASARPASSAPCSAMSALLAVTTGLPSFSAASTATLAGPSDPPMSSTKRSFSPEDARATGSSNQGRAEMSVARGRERERAHTPVTRAVAPVGEKSGLAAMRSSRPTPTVPSPATPIRHSFVALAIILSTEPPSAPYRPSWRGRCSSTDVSGTKS
jgi:hypothetical protein